MRALLRLLSLPLLLLAASPLLAADAATFSAEQKTAIEKIVRDYLLAHPEVLDEMAAELKRREREAMQARVAGIIIRNREQVLASGYDHIVNPDGKVPVVEFFDYNCGYCKRMFPAMQKLQAHDDLRIVFKELPIINDASVEAARVAIAAKRQDKYLVVHNMLMRFPGRVDGKVALQVAQQLGLDIERLKKDMEDPAIGAEIDANMALAEALGVRGTPTLLIGETFIPGAMPYEELMTIVEARRENCQIC